jgi:hypothetical protein
MQVKFRGKIINEPNGILNGQWQYGSLIEEPPSTYRIRAYHRNASGSHDYSEYQVEPESIGMFTGLQDRKGNEIYGAIGDKGGDVFEGEKMWGDSDDPLKSRPICYEVYWDKAYAGFVTMFGPLTDAQELTKVGTHFDNPGLLEE